MILTEDAGWIRADELQDKRLDALEQRLMIIENTLIEVKALFKMIRALAIGVAGVLGLNLQQIML